MMNKKRMLIFVVFVVVVIGVFFVYNLLIFKGELDIVKEVVLYEMIVSVLYVVFDENEVNVNDKYVGVVIIVSGVL